MWQEKAQTSLEQAQSSWDGFSRISDFSAGFSITVFLEPESEIPSLHNRAVLTLKTAVPEDL